MARLVFFFAIWSFLAGCATDPTIDTKGWVDATNGITYYSPPRVCPPADGSSWYPEPTTAPSSKIEWIVLDHDDPGPCDPHHIAQGSQACAWLGPTLNGVGKVYAWRPRYTFTESYIQHEECHTMGWNHGPHGRTAWTIRGTNYAKLSRDNASSKRPSAIAPTTWQYCSSAILSRWVLPTCALSS